MEDTLVTVAIHTYEKAQILRSVLEIHGIDVFMQNVNPLLPAMSLGVRVRIRQSDLDKALNIIENMKNEDAVSQALNEERVLLMPVDFSDYSIKICEFGFRVASILGLKAILFHTYTVAKTVMATIGDAYATKKDDENKKQAEKESSEKMNHLREMINNRITQGEMPNVEYMCVIREGIPEEQILEYSDLVNPLAIMMGTRGCSQKDLDMIGSVTAEVMERANVPVFTIPENTHFITFDNVKQIACSTNFDDEDLSYYEDFLKLICKMASSDVMVHFIHYDSNEDPWAEVKLRGLKDYFSEQFPTINMKSHLLKGPDLLTTYDEYIRTNEVDVISLTTHRRSLLTRMFNPSMARKIVFHTNTPMLVFHAK